ncbi:basement membrane-specific heparan sulfate proteoglycan core protein isoform X9 [Dermochelys coriacea]|uniref:basement membrane-specific heparan sulfate proteoglycan core protein isoform X9 n=1 Tax=Dermochelys coriacea TaxID=27794 RepID=UPI001CA9DD3C|nr:basement membrane-specific heparan sulfate proteoglycan core protein isoform X9 [Dermochelys coriacea]
MLADEASGDGNGSGENGSGIVLPDMPLSTSRTPSVTLLPMVYFRALVNFTQSIDYSPRLDDANSEEFREVSEAVVDTLESEYYKIGGEQVVSVVFIKEIDGYTFVELDVGSEGNLDEGAIREVLYSIIKSGSIASYITSTQGFQFRRLGAVPLDVRTCTGEEFACSSGECIEKEFRCDRRPDCRDMSDELDCECPSEEFRCSTGECLPLAYRCDRSPDCRDGSDEHGCDRQEVVTFPPLPITTAQPATTRTPTTSPSTPMITTRRVPATTPLRLVTPKHPPIRHPLEQRPCRRDEAVCSNKQCIPRDYLCDGERDCLDGSDELSCGTPTPCEPNEFKCRNGHCALKLWRCDGDNDCVDGSDEVDCPTKGPDDTCSPDQFICVSSRTCIPASYQCDEEADCPDRSDEVGCTPPQVITPPEESVQAVPGQTVRFRCVAVGVPTPIITWRLNWGHIPANRRVSISSENGHGMLTIRDVKEADQGAYTCEAINARGMVFGIPDGVLSLTPRRGPCPEGHFHVEGTSKCLACFCFGITTACHGTSRYRDQIHLRFDTPEDFKGVNVTTPAQLGTLPLSSTQLQIDPALQEFQLVDLSRRFLAQNSFWTLPSQFLGNKVDSYGGYLSFQVRYGLARGQSEPVQKSSVVIVGNGQKLIYRVQVPTQPSVINQRQIHFTEENWQHESGAPVSRETLLLALQNLESILVQTVYDNKMASVGLSNIAMDTTTMELTSQGMAQGVEECRCPIGYLGLSCERCDAHFERVPEGPYLGTCSGCNCHGHSSSCDRVFGYCLNCQHNTEGPQCNKCKPGFFGDATRGNATACRACPCPYTDSARRFSNTCFLDTDGQATCDDCAPGYTGRRCESCARGYEGNPMQPGGRCVRTAQEFMKCDKRGSSDSTGGSCRCKPNVVGRLCNECTSGAFYLSDQNPDGCLKCFCMGVSRQCASSSWNREQVRATDNEQAHFSLANLANTRTVSEGIRSPSHAELAFSAFHSLPSDVYYWVLPDRFKGDKVTSYGGELHYTVMHSAAPSAHPLPSQPDVLLRGNGIFLEHFAEAGPLLGTPTRFTVPFRERAWRRADGQDATREHLLMALADIDLFMIRASYMDRPAESRLSNIHMDVAVPHATGLEQAMEVEECTCPPGYRGPSCQDCDVGYARTTSGLYLGTCERCDCSGHSAECDAETGDCQNCQDNTEGTRCERCQSGYYGDARRGTPADCQPCPCHRPYATSQATKTCFLDTDGQPTCNACTTGYVGRQCQRCAPGYLGNPSLGQPCRESHEPNRNCSCDPQGSVSRQCDASRQCQCKLHVEGPSCSSCRANHFHLSAENRDGCLPCFCMGVTQQCTSSSYYRGLVTSPFLPGNFQSFALVNRQHSTRIVTGFAMEPLAEGPQLSFGHFGQLGQESYYWQLPEPYQGDKVGSYGGRLRYTLSYNSGGRSAPLPDADVQITGNDITLVAYQPDLQPRERQSFEIILQEQYWKRPDGQHATREHLMMVLADLDEILIRATYSTDMVSASIAGVSMETAVPNYSSLPRALEVEECRCPPGYRGLSCQDCAAGYTRTGGGLYLGHCELCECNGHSDSCHPETGACSNCLHNAAGEFCEQCAPGYYGDATAGTPEDCQPCACPLSEPENQFSRTCESLGAGGYRCSACDPGYTGQYCEQCAPGYVGNPSMRGQKCVPVDQAPFVVRVHPPKTTVSQGGEVTLRCQASGSPPYYYSWSREDGHPVPSTAQSRRQGEELHFPSIHPSEAGVYICTCRSLQHSHASRAEVIVTEAPSKPITVTVEEKRVQSVKPGADVTFICTAKSQSPAYTLVWTRQNHGKLPRRAMDFNGILTIRKVQPEDAGIYVCTGSNMLDMAEGTATLHVQAPSKTQMFYGPIEVMEGHRPSATAVLPMATIEPAQLTVQPGQPAEFRCIATGSPLPTIEWIGGHAGIMSRKAVIQGGTLRFPSVEPSDEAEYLCRVRSSAGQHVARAFLQVHRSSVLQVQVSPERTEVQEGSTVRLYCRAAGSPTATITWEKQGGSLPPQSRSEHTDIATLVIPSITAADSGVYLCIGTSPAGVGSARIEVVVLRASGMAPPIRIEASSSSIAEGQTLDLNCLVAGQAPVTVTWYKRGGSLPARHQVSGSHLRISQVSAADSGEYVCRVIIGASPREASIPVTVQHSTGFPHAPPIWIESSSSAVTEGQSLDLKCLVAGQSPATVMWYKRGGALPAGHQVSGSHLRLVRVSVANSGEYVCRVSTGTGIQEASIIVTIYRATGSPYSSGVESPVRIESSSSSIAEGQTMDLKCLVAGQAPAMVTWYKRRGSLPASHQVSGSHLRLVQVSAADSGEYVCRISTSAGPREASITVSVSSGTSSSYRLQSPIISIEPHSTAVRQGEDATFKCRIHDGARPINITWKMAPKQQLQDNVKISPNGSVITISRARPSNQGAYRCLAFNRYGVANSVVNLMVQGSPTVSVVPKGPVTVKTGKSISVDCLGMGDPRPLVRWSRLGMRQKIEHQTLLPLESQAVLQISAAKPEDAGTYICMAQNSIGSAQVQVEVSVEAVQGKPGAPEITVKPTLTVVAGETATLQCSATGDPPPTIQWSKLRAPLPWQHRVVNNTLLIPRVAQQDSGQYICNASNAASFTEAFVTLDVEIPPYATSLPEEVSVQVGEAVQLQCLAHGTPPLHYQWTKANGSLSSHAVLRESALHISPIAPEDSGTYRCLVSNRVGSAETFAQVSVEGSAPSASPTVRVTPQTDVKGVGGTAEFTCSVTGGAQARIEWFREGGELPASHSVRNGVLRIQNLDRGCQGVYTCRVSSPSGQAQDSARLVIQALPKVMINVRTSVQSVLVGATVEFECLVVGDPKARITWSKVGSRIRPEVAVSGGMVKIERVEQSDAGQYRCTATNDMGTMQSNVILHVQSIPQIAAQPEVKEVTSGSRAVLPCLASGFPVPEIKWTKLEGDLPKDICLENNILTIPSVKPEDAGIYVCTASNRQGKVTAFSMLKVQERVVPYFTQNPQTFLALPTIKDAYKKFEIQITFRPDTADGMLLYNGQKKSTGADFVSFGLVGGRPEFRFDAGSGMATIRHPAPIRLGAFHTVQLYRNLTQGSLVLDSHPPVNGTSQGKFQGLDLNEELYLGGYPDYNAVAKSGLSSGFVGCVRQLLVQGEEVIFKDLDLRAHGVSNCPTCRDRPCQNGGICRDSESSSYVCHCPQEFTGSNCEHSQALHCHPEACGPDATCINRADGQGYHCRCHLGKSGETCMEGVMATTPSFNGSDSFISYPPLTNIHYELRLEVAFKPLSPSGLILFSGGPGAPVADFVSLAMASGRVEFRYELGSGMAVLQSTEPLALGQWHKVSAERINKDGTLQVDSSKPVKRSSPGKSQGLNLRTPMYLGGVDKSVTLPAAASISSSFHGCIGEVLINEKKVDISYSFLQSQGITQCYDSSPCDRRPCLHGATCMPTGEYEFQCLCQDGFRGNRCEFSEDQCLLRNPCLNGGTCKANQCLCLAGFSGTYCEQGLALAALDREWALEGSGGNDAPGQYGAYFQGSGYLALPRHVLPRSYPKSPETIELEVRTRSPNGLLLWQGVVTGQPALKPHAINEEQGQSGKAKDFISLGLTDGHLVFSYQLGSGEASIVSEDPINDGEWHRVTAVREGRRGSIQVDGEELVSGESPGSNVMVNTQGSVYIGGAPAIRALTAGKFRSGITGCIKNLVLSSEQPGQPPRQPIDLQHHAEAGVNVQECPS